MKSKKGFSLLELLIVVGIIGVLVALSLPSYQKYILKTERVETFIFLKGIHSAQLAYFGSHDQYVVGNPATVNQRLGLGPITHTPFGYKFSDYLGMPENQGFAVVLSKDLDEDISLDQVLLHQNFSLPIMDNCSQGIPLIMLDDLTETTHPCWLT